MSREEKIKNVVEKVFKEILNKKQLDDFDSIFDEKHIMYQGNNKYVGRESLLKNIEDRARTVPDLAYKIDDLVIEGNKVFVRWHGRGTSKENFADFKAGQPIVYWGLSLWDIGDNDKIVRSWETSTIADSIPER